MANTDPNRLKSWAAILASIAGLITAIAAILKPQDHSVTKSSYEELSTGLKNISEQESKNHDDIVALRGYLSGMNGEVLMPPEVIQPSGVDAGLVLQPLIRPLASASAAPSASTRIVFRIIDAGAPPALRGDQPKYDPPSFDKILSQSKK